MLWNHQLREGTIRAEATLIRQVEIPTQTWPVRSRYHRMPHPTTTRGYTLDMVIADKLGCISQRAAPRDFYDIVRVLDHGADMNNAWSLYTEQFNNPRRTHTWRPFPTNIHTAYTRHLPQLAHRWETDADRGVLPPNPPLRRPIRQCRRGRSQHAGTLGTAIRSCGAPLATGSAQPART